MTATGAERAATDASAVREPAPPARLPSLTSLRFVAAALVVVVHLQTIWPEARILQRGEVGVSFFYLLSGFILTWSASSGDTPARFYRRRFARIAPVHVVTWFAAIAVALLLGNGFGSVLGDVLSLPLLQAWVPVGSVAYAANGVSWSLSVELLFYLCFPFLLPRLRRLPTGWLWTVAGTTVAVTWLVPVVAPTAQFAYSFPLSRLPEFVVGVTVALLVQRGWRPPLGFAAAAALAAGAIAVDFAPWLPEPFAFAAVSVIPFALLIAAACASDRKGTSRMAGRTWVRLGQWSFALFMTHQIVIRSFAGLVPEHRLQVLLLAPVLALCVGIAGLLFHAVERPLERRLRGSRAHWAETAR